MPDDQGGRVVRPSGDRAVQALDRLARVGRAVRDRLAPPPPPRPESQLRAVTDVGNLVTLQAVRVAVTIGLPDLIASGFSTTGELATRTATDVDALDRLLRHLVARGIFRADGSGRLALSEVGALLVSDHPTGSGLDFRLDGAPPLFDAVIQHLLYSIRTGRPAWDQVHRRSLWEQVAEDPAVATSFDRDMDRRARVMGPELITAYDWTGISTLVDVGGGSGGVTVQLLQGRKDLRATIVESSGALARARATLHASGLTDRCDVVQGSFFDPLPGGRDAYLLSWILHDWDDEHSISILERCAEAARPSGRVLIVEKPTDASPDTELDLRMLLFFGGKERSRPEYERLVELSGLECRGWTQLPSGSWVLDGRPV